MHERDIEEYFVALMGDDAESAAPAAPPAAAPREGVVAVLSMLRVMLFRARRDTAFLVLSLMSAALVVFFPLFAGLSKVLALNIVVISRTAGLSVFHFIGMTRRPCCRGGAASRSLPSSPPTSKRAPSKTTCRRAAAERRGRWLRQRSRLSFRRRSRFSRTLRPTWAFAWQLRPGAHQPAGRRALGGADGGDAFGYVAVATLAITITRSEIVGILAAVLLIGGAVEQVLLGLYSLALGPSAATTLYEHMPIADLSALRGSPLPGAAASKASWCSCAPALWLRWL